MRRAILALAMLLAGFSARADYLCVPKEIGGTGTYYRLTTTADAFALQWVCTTATGSFAQGLVWLKTFAPSLACWGAAPSGPSPTADLVGLANAISAACSTDELAGGHYANPKLDEAYQAGLSAIRAAWAVDHPSATLVYRTPNNSQRIYAVTPAGSLGATVAGKTAAPSSLCDCSLFSTSIGSSKYCALAGGAANECTYCVPASQ